MQSREQNDGVMNFFCPKNLESHLGSILKPAIRARLRAYAEAFFTKHIHSFSDFTTSAYVEEIIRS